jgi:catechol 2,3-dioxygenase-like lactoylglutathione lyase family enzyme
MSGKTKTARLAVLMCVCAIPAFTQNTAPKGQNPAGPAGPVVSKKAEEKMTFESLTPNLIVSDIDRSAAFYLDVLGFQQVTTVPEKAPFVFVWLKHGDVNVFLNVPQPEKAAPPLKLDKAVAGTNSMYVKLHGIDELAQRVREHGVTPSIPMHKEFYGMKEFAVVDPDGYLIIFAEPTQ